MKDEFNEFDFQLDFNPEFIRKVRFAFRPDIARKILQRDRWSCQCGCGGSLRDGQMMEVAHYPEKHNRKLDTYIPNGRALTRRCHLNEHLDMLQAEYSEYNLASAKLSAQNCFTNGFHTWKHYETQPEQLDQDRTELVLMLESRGLNPQEFIDFEKTEFTSANQP